MMSSTIELDGWPAPADAAVESLSRPGKIDSKLIDCWAGVDADAGMESLSSPGKIDSKVIGGVARLDGGGAGRDEDHTPNAGV